MAYSYVQYTGNGATTNYAFAFPYLDSSHIKVRVNGVITSFTFLNSSTVQITPAPIAGAIIDIRRETPKDSPPVNFTDGSVLLEKDLDLLAAFNLYTAQESADGVADSITKDTTGVWDAQSRRIKSVADPVNPNDAVNKTWAETAMSSQLGQAIVQANNASASATAAANSASSASSSASTATTKANEASASATASANSASASQTSATNSANSASTATTKANEASASATVATTKANEASASASSASNSATSASNSASTATTKATEASNSATSASNSATTATTQANIATTKANEATASATSASNSASTASGHANTASTKANEATASATLANDWATKTSGSVAGGEFSAKYHAQQASSSASSASASASSASASASDAALSATSAASSAASAAALLDNFDDRYLGPKASAPTVDNDGNALILGSLYFDTTSGKMRVYTASGWIDASSASVATLANYQFNATAGQTTFSGTAAVGGTLTYTVGAVIVTLNGVLLEAPSEYTATNGTSIVLASGASAGDELNVYAFGNFLVADTYSRAEADNKFITNTTGVINIGSGQVYKDSSGNVGIGTTSPNINTNGTVLHINNNTASRAAMLHMTNGSSGSTATDGLIVGKWSDNDNYFWDYEAQALVFGTNSTERMRIDSSGRVTMPFQPLFVATASSTNWGWSNNKITAFDQIPYGQNIGSHYNTSTQRFTAPVTGNYLFNLKITLNANFGNFQIRVHKNGNWHQTLVGQASGAANDQRSGTALVQLNANDYVELFGTGSHSGMLSGVGSCEFSGQLIG